MSDSSKRVLTIFDVDGTLLTNRYAVRDAFLEAFEAVTGSSGVRRKPQFAGNTDRGIFRLMLEDAEIEGEYETLYARWEEVFLKKLSEVYPKHPDPHLLPGVKTLIGELAMREDVLLALGTGNTRRSCRIKLERFGLNDYFPAGGFGGDHEVRTDVIRAAMSEARDHYGEYDEAWVIGDTIRDVAAARGAGIKVLAVETGLGSVDELRTSEPDRILPDLTDITAFLTALGLS
jgi:phosphoglycolate phosphatase-like HAD superfamily hydrolase